MCVTKSEHPFLLSHGSWKSGGGGGPEAESSPPDSPKTRFINKATGSSLGGPQHHILLL